MAHFYGKVGGQARTFASRRGSAKSGLEAVAASWEGAVKTTLTHRDGVDWARVELMTWSGRGTNRILYDGPVSGDQQQEAA